MQNRLVLVLASALALACATAACDDKKDPGTSPAASVSATTSATPLASTAAPSVSAPPSEVASAAPSAEGSATAKTSPPDAKKDGGSIANAAASGSAAPAECGTKPQPDCPLQAWMKANANPPVMKSDLPGLATALDKIGAFAPPGYTNWASIAKDGATGARGGDLAAAKAACRTCHDQYKTKYKTEIRARKI